MRIRRPSFDRVHNYVHRCRCVRVLRIALASCLIGALSAHSADDPQQSVAAEDELAAQPVSNAAKTRLERARDSIVQIRGFFGDSQSDAFHGSGFCVTDDGLIVTNYHVVSQAVLYPKEYRLEFLAPNGTSGRLRVQAVDIEHDLAIVKADDFRPPPLRARTQIPLKGERAYSIGYPLNLGLTITEGVANGLVENSLEQRIYYSGAMNGGMSGGPALDNVGAVYGVNVSVITGRQSVSFVVPAKHIGPLLRHARTPLDIAGARAVVASQLDAHQTALFASIPAKLATQTAAGYSLPGKITPAVECNSDGTADPTKLLSIETIGCRAHVGVFVEFGLETGELRYWHRVVRSDRLTPLQFAEQVNRIADSIAWTGSRKHVAQFVCRNELVALRGFDARVGTCVRQYRMFDNLYDIGVSVTSVGNGNSAVISHLSMRGVAFAQGMEFAHRYLEAMRWTP